MRFTCKPAEPAFFDRAPWRFVNEVELNRTPDRVFAVFEDAASWPKWFKGIKRVEWTTPQPFGVGTTRTVTLDSVVFERFFRWEPGRRFSFDFAAASAPLFNSFAEDYLLEPLAGGRTRFTYTVGIDPGFLLQVTAPIARKNFESMFKGGALGLQRFCQ